MANGVNAKTKRIKERNRTVNREGNLMGFLVIIWTVNRQKGIKIMRCSAVFRP